MANSKILPKLAKKFPLCKLYPDSNIIGGKRTRKKAVGENDSSFFKSSSGKILITAPMKAPRNTEKYEKY